MSRILGYALSQQCSAHNTELREIGQSFFKYIIIKWLSFACIRHMIWFLCEGAPRKGKKVFYFPFLMNSRTTTCLYLCAM